MHFPIHYKQISRPGDGHIDAALALYHICFPSVERQPEAVIRERVSSGLASLTVGLLNDEVACFAITWSFQHPAVNFLDYLAVDPRYRASGYGSGLLKFLEQQYKINNEYLVLEVEHPGFGNNKEERIKRISFYQKAGAVICSDQRYVLPPIIPGNEAIEMLLMIMPYPGETYLNKNIKAIIKNIYLHVYGRGENDPWLQLLM